MTITDKQVDAALVAMFDGLAVLASDSTRCRMRAALEAADRVAADAAQAVGLRVTHQHEPNVWQHVDVDGPELERLVKSLQEQGRVVQRLYASPPPPADDARRDQAREWLEKMVRREEAAEARGESTDCTVYTPSALPSCLCCGRPGVAKCWHAERPEIYVCEQCHAKATETRHDDARGGGETVPCLQCGTDFPKPPEPHLHCPACCRLDSDRLDDIASEYLHLEPFDMPTGVGDADVGWRIKRHTLANGLVVVAEVFEDDLRAAIDAASGYDRAMGAQGGES